MVSRGSVSLLPAWMSHPWANTKWVAAYGGWQVLYHLIRSPAYLFRILAAAPRGFGRVVGATWRWLSDAEARPMHKAAARALQVEHYLYLSYQRTRRTRVRILIAIGVVLAAAVAINLLIAVSTGVTVLAALLVIAGFGMLGRLDMAEESAVTLTQPVERRLTQERLAQAFVSAKLAFADRPLAFVRPISRDGEGWSVTVDLPYGMKAATALEKREEIAAGLDVDEARIFITRVRGDRGSARRIEMWVADADPYAKPTPIAPFADGKRVDFWKGIPFGLDARRRPVVLHLMWSNLLIGSVPRMGKTNAARLVAAAAALDPDVNLVIIDGKGGADWRPFADVAVRFHRGVMEEEVSEVARTLKELVDDMNRRYQIIGDLPHDRVPDAKLTPELARDPSLNASVTLVVVDEVQRYLENPTYGKNILASLTELAKVGSAVGMILVLATQKPDAKVIPDGLRGQLGSRFALRVMTWQASDTILGAGSYPAYNAANFLKSHLGVGWLLGGEDNPEADIDGRLVRTYQCDMPTVVKIIDKAVETRGRQQAEDADKIEILVAVEACFGDDEKLAPGELVDRLAKFDKRFEGMTTRQLASRLRAHNIQSKPLRIGGEVVRGYTKVDCSTGDPSSFVLQVQNPRSEP